MARCGMCKKSNMGELVKCFADHEVKFPTMVNDHDCQDFEYEPAGEIVHKTLHNVPEHEYCEECAHCLNEICDGKKWVPYKTEPKCEFFRDASLTCKHAVPFIQYGNGIRNNRCALRNDEKCCPWAHTSTNMKCYERKRGSYGENNTFSKTR